MHESIAYGNTDLCEFVLDTLAMPAWNTLRRTDDEDG